MGCTQVHVGLGRGVLCPAARPPEHRKRVPGLGDDDDALDDQREQHLGAHKAVPVGRDVAVHARKDEVLHERSSHSDDVHHCLDPGVRHHLHTHGTRTIKAMRVKPTKAGVQHNAAQLHVVVEGE